MDGSCYLHSRTLGYFFMITVVHILINEYLSPMFFHSAPDSSRIDSHLHPFYLALDHSEFSLLSSDKSVRERWSQLEQRTCNPLVSTMAYQHLFYTFDVVRAKTNFFRGQTIRSQINKTVSRLRRLSFLSV